MSLPVIEIVVFGLFTITLAVASGSVLARLGFPFPPPERRLGCVDGLRGLLALSVFLHHFIIWMGVDRFGQPWGPSSINAFDSLGSGAVALFFMTTGFLFYPRIITGFRRTNWRSLLFGRIFRLMPLVAASILLITIVLLFRIRLNVESKFHEYAIAFLTWLFSIGEPPLLGVADSGRLNAYVLWSLGYEWTFYILILPFCALIRDIIRPNWPTWWLPAGLLVLTLALRPLADYLPLIRYLPLFMIGMLAYEVQSRRILAQWLQTRTVAVAALTALALGMISSASPYGPIQMPLYGAFFIAVASGNNLFGLLRLRGALVLGDISFGIYLLHGTVLAILFTEFRDLERLLPAESLPTLLPFTCLVVIFIAGAAHLVVERPGIRAGKWLSEKWRPVSQT